MSEDESQGSAEDSVRQFAADLRARRLAAGLSVRQVAKVGHVSHSTINDAERGRRGVPTDLVVAAYIRGTGGTEGDVRQWRDRARQLREQLHARASDSHAVEEDAAGPIVQPSETTRQELPPAIPPFPRPVPASEGSWISATRTRIRLLRASHGNLLLVVGVVLLVLCVGAAARAFSGGGDGSDNLTASVPTITDSPGQHEASAEPSTTPSTTATRRATPAQTTSPPGTFRSETQHTPAPPPPVNSPDPEPPVNSPDPEPPLSSPDPPPIIQSPSVQPTFSPPTDGPRPGGDCEGSLVTGGAHEHFSEGEHVATTYIYYDAASGDNCAIFRKNVAVGVDSYLALTLCNEIGQCDRDRYYYAREAGPVSIPGSGMCVTFTVAALSPDRTEWLLPEESTTDHCG